MPDDRKADGVAGDADLEIDLDEDAVKEAIEQWDDLAIDPSLDEILGTRSSQEKETEDLLEEVSDLIETLASYQRNRHLSLPTSQDRYSADPINGDMLRNGAQSQQLSDEEMTTYQVLKMQLAQIIQTLPPYVVARLNSERLAELSVSTRMEVRTEECRGVMEEDEPSRLKRQASIAAASSQRQPPPHRTPSMSAATPYGHHQQYAGQYAQAARQAGPQYHSNSPQTPSRPQPSSMYQQRPVAPASIAPQPHHQRAPQPAQQFRPGALANHGYTPAMSKSSQGPYMHQFPPGSAQQQRVASGAPHPGYAIIAQVNNTPPPNQHRPPVTYAPGQVQQAAAPMAHPFPQQPYQVPRSPMPQFTHIPPQQQAGYSPYPNGVQTGRTMSPQVGNLPYAHQSATQHHLQPQTIAARPFIPYGGSPAMQPGIPPNQMRGQRTVQYPPGAPMPGGLPPQQQHHHSPGQQPQSMNVTGFKARMSDAEQRQVLEQAKAHAYVKHMANGNMGAIPDRPPMGGFAPPRQSQQYTQSGAANTNGVHGGGVPHGGPSTVNGGIGTPGMLATASPSPVDLISQGFLPPA